MTSPSVIYLLVAQKEGYFKSEGLNVEIINMRGELAAKITTIGEIDFFTQQPVVEVRFSHKAQNAARR